MVSEDVVIKFEGDASGFLTALNEVNKSLNSLSKNLKVPQKQVDKTSRSFTSLSLGLRELRWGLIGANFFMNSLSDAAKDLWKNTESLYDIDWRLAGFLSMDMKAAMLGFTVDINNVKKDIQGRAVPAIIELTTALDTTLMDAYNILSEEQKNFLGDIAGFQTIMAPAEQAILDAATGVLTLTYAFKGLKDIGAGKLLSGIGKAFKFLGLVGTLEIAALIFAFIELGAAISIWSKDSVSDLNWFEKIVASIGGYIATTLYVLGQVFVGLGNWIGLGINYGVTKITELQLAAQKGTKFINELFGVSTTGIDASIKETLVQIQSLRDAEADMHSNLLNVDKNIASARNNLAEDLITMWGDTPLGDLQNQTNSNLNNTVGNLEGSFNNTLGNQSTSKEFDFGQLMEDKKGVTNNFFIQETQLGETCNSEGWGFRMQ